MHGFVLPVLCKWLTTYKLGVHDMKVRVALAWLCAASALFFVFEPECNFFRQQPRESACSSIVARHEDTRPTGGGCVTPELLLLRRSARERCALVRLRPGHGKPHKINHYVPCISLLLPVLFCAIHEFYNQLQVRASGAPQSDCALKSLGMHLLDGASGSLDEVDPFLRHDRFRLQVCGEALSLSLSLSLSLLLAEAEGASKGGGAGRAAGFRSSQGLIALLPGACNSLAKHTTHPPPSRRRLHATR